VRLVEHPGQLGIERARFERVDQQMVININQLVARSDVDRVLADGIVFF